MALELDIFQDTTANTLFADSTMLAEEEEQSTRTGSFQGTTYQDVLDWFEETGRSTDSGTAEYRTTSTQQALKGMEQDDNGHYYNSDGDRVYVFRDPAELGDDSGGYAGRNIVMRTEREIRDAFEADQGMGYFKEANPDLSVDDYVEFIREVDELYASGQIILDPTNELYNHKEIGRGPNSDRIRAILVEEDQRRKQVARDSVGALMEKYGIQESYQNSDGDTFKWNGSNYTKTYKVDDSFDVGGFVNSIALAALTAGAAGFLAPTLAGALGVSNTVAKGLITAAIDLSQGEEIGLGTALSLVGGDVLPGGATIGEMVDNGNITQDVLDAIVGEITNPDNYRNDDITVVWEGHGGTDEIGNPVINIPDFTKDSDEDDGGGGAAEDPSASNDDTGDSADSAGSEGSGIVNETGEEVTTGGEEVDGTGTQTGAEYRWKYIGNGCFVQIDENGVEIPGTKVCDPDYTEEDYSLYEVGGIFGRGTDAPFGSSDDEGEDTTSSYEPSPAGTDLGYECLPNGDKVVFTADGKGGSTTEVIKGGCLENEGTGGVIVTGGNDGDDSSGGTTDSTGDTETGEADEDADGDGTEGTGESGAGDDGVGDDGTGEGEGGDGNGDGEGNGITSPAVSAFDTGSYEGTVQGLSYVAQPVPGLMSGPPVDAMGELNNLISNQMKKRGMLV